ncbi:putative transcriptional regulator [Swaminathania salitolerans LMG 21291]|nr:putative transcriptional regulator [Swaminathania salitolerans LMG 21291]
MSGLRREEAAQLCGISTTWYTWLEQGRDISCSASALGRIASSLRLSPAEREYVFALAELRDPDGSRSASDEMPSPVAGMPDLLKVPCYVLDALWNIRVANEAACTLFGAWFGAGDRNLLDYVFLDPEARRFMDRWEHNAQRVLAEFRSDSLHGETEKVGALVSRLRAASRDFERLWHQQAVTTREGGPRRFHHPADGVLDFEQTTLGFTTWPQYRMVVLRPVAGLR